METTTVSTTESDISIIGKGKSEPFWDDDLRNTWRSNPSRDWTLFMRNEQFTYSWDFMEIERRSKTK